MNCSTSIITTDNDAKKIIDNYLDKELTENGRKILSFVRQLFDTYSFVDNQTYPRPTHPNKAKRANAYFTLLAIIISLRTTLENETKAVNKILKKYHNIDDILSADIHELKEAIKCAGMPEKKAWVIINMSNFIKEKYNGNINNINTGNVQEIRKKLLEIPGIGEKSADCMIELGFDLPSIVVDTNVFRVISKMFFERKMFFENKQDIIDIKKFLENNLPADFRIYQIVHTMLLLHGKYICKSVPKCNICEKKNECIFYNKRRDKQLSFFKLLL